MNSSSGQPANGRNECGDTKQARKWVRGCLFFVDDSLLTTSYDTTARNYGDSGRREENKPPVPLLTACWLETSKDITANVNNMKAWLISSLVFPLISKHPSQETLCLRASRHKTFCLRFWQRYRNNTYALVLYFK